MSEEKLRILEMLSEGKITAQEAMELLKQVPDADRDEEARPHRHHWHNRRDNWHDWRNWEQWMPRRPYTLDLSWINDLRDAVEETARSALSPDDFAVDARREKFTSVSGIGDGIRALVFDGKNAPIKLDAYGGDKIEVEAYYKSKSQWNPHLALTEENGVFRLSYDYNALFLLGICIRVPETACIASVRLKNKNAPISVNDIKAEKIELSTKNQAIKVSDVKCEYLNCDTKNAPIMLDDVEAEEIDAQTSNAKISLNDVSAFRIRMITNNAKININDLIVTQLYAQTSDSPLKIENLGYNEQEPVCSIDAITTNSQISVRLSRKEALQCRLRASTTVGGIFNELSGMAYMVNERNYAEAQTEGYETAQNKLSLNLQTTNGGIYIKK